MLTQRNTIALTFCLLSSLTVGAQNQQPAKRAGTIVPLPRDLEIQLALSSLPAHLRDHATVYVLNPAKGFEIAQMQAKGTPPQDLKRIIQRRYKTHVYKAPERAGVSYMLSPILRTYSNPEVDGTLATSMNPHVMHYAPNVSNEDVGGAFPAPEVMQYYIQHGRWPASPAPFVILPGPHGYHIQMLGVTEAAAITKEY